MKKITAILVFTLLLLLPLSALAQTGSVLFEKIEKLEINLPPEMESMRDQIPTENTTSLVLYFNEYESLMKNAPEAEKPEDIVSQTDGMFFRMSRGGQAENETYNNYDEGTVIQKQDFMGRTFLIDGEQDPYAWKLTGEQSEYLGFEVQKATAVRDSTKIEAWFSPEIPVGAGPELYTGLPGMILVLSVDDGQTVFSAKHINLEITEDGMIKAPKKGKRVSRSKYDSIVAEKMEEMEAQRSGHGGGVFHVIRH